ncbi:reverse transcriptase-like protein [Litorilinea aerophila]|nr:ribonuclease HI family protein [Litorilinea aerophila]MCC9077000.1 reverse transcriptase-like protein [Litorilinea aerophila]GIV76792.1 MAG: hypothetical protein KatS3mg050_1186 [Litorilinea sp.]
MAETDQTLEALVEAIAGLTPDQRRRLQRRLRLSGLWEPEELLTDRNRLAVAPALARRPGARPSRRTTPTPLPATSDTEYQSPVSGKVVRGAPTEVDGAVEPHAMPPLPGQAPEQPIVIIFDGGSKGNPGLGYGSYALRWPGQPQQVVQLRFGDRVTNNEAEYDTLISALEATLKRLEDSGADPATARVEIYGDSQLVVNQVNGRWACNEDRLRVRRDRALALLNRFGHWRLRHHGREHSVRVLGH